jgi:hypothetical protein
MKVVVVFESMFGNTKMIAEGITEGLRGAGAVVCGAVDDVAPEEARGAALIVAGGPTHAHGMARANAHEALAANAAHRPPGQLLPGRESLRRWLDLVPPGSGLAAAFDTRFHKPRWLTGSAARKIARLLRRKGYAIAGMESFFVETAGGPLAAGERERAVAWGRNLAAGLQTSAAA